MATAKAKAAVKPLTKTEILSGLAEKTGLTKKEVQLVFDEMGDMIRKHLGRRGPGVFSIPNLVKLKVTRKPATKARPGTNPFTGEQITIKAKPARNAVRATPLKALKDMA